MVKTNDGNFALAFTYEDSMGTFGSLMKLNSEMDTIWKKDYDVSYRTILQNCTETNDMGFILTGWVWDSEEDYADILLLKTDSLGAYKWHQIYGSVSYAEKALNVIEADDGGYLIGGYKRNPPIYESLDAMVIKTDSLGNEEWTKFYGNPGVDDDNALVAMYNDGNCIIATVYGEWTINPYNGTRAGRMLLVNVDAEGNTIWEKKIGPVRNNLWLKNFRKTNCGYIATGLSAETDSATYQYYSGWMMKLDNNLDSTWHRDYFHGDENWESFLYDAYPTSDNGYVAVGKARPGVGGTSNKMWILKVDSMGCDTAGCATGVFIEELFPYVRDRGEVLTIWPNPTNSRFKVSGLKFKVAGNRIIRIYNLQGLKVEVFEIPKSAESLQVDVSNYNKGIYYLQYIHSNQIMSTVKFIKN
jgi:hypothetical protein